MYVTYVTVYASYRRLIDSGRTLGDDVTYARVHVYLRRVKSANLPTIPWKIQPDDESRSEDELVLFKFRPRSYGLKNSGDPRVLSPAR